MQYYFKVYDLVLIGKLNIYLFFGLEMFYLCVLVYGVGYVWSLMILDVSVGDFIEWKWFVVVGVFGINIGVYQIDIVVVIISFGFFSGVVVFFGLYKYQVIKIGDVFYWSDYVDVKKEIIFRGVIKVISRFQFVEDFILKFSGYEVEYDIVLGIISIVIKFIF